MPPGGWAPGGGYAGDRQVVGEDAAAFWYDHQAVPLGAYEWCPRTSDQAALVTADVSACTKYTAPSTGSPRCLCVKRTVVVRPVDVPASNLAFVGASEIRSLEPRNHRRIARQRTALQRVIDHEVDAAVHDGDFRNDHPREASRVIVTMCTALPTWWRPGGPLTPEQHVGFALDLMRRRSAAA